MDKAELKSIQNRAAELELLPAYTLDMVFSQFAAQPFSMEQLVGLGTSAAGGAELALGLGVLRKAGIVKAVQKTWGERLFYLPLEVLISLQQNKFAKLQLAVENEQLEPDTGGGPTNIKLISGAKPGLADDLFRALSIIARGDLPFTAKGTAHQRALTQFASALNLIPQDVEELNLRYPEQESCPADAAVVLDMALSLGLAEKGVEAWGVREATLALWLSQTRRQMDTTLIYELLERYVPPEAGLQHFACALLLSCFEPGRWYGYSAVLQGLASGGIEIAEQSGTAWCRSWLKALCAFGWAELGVSGEGGDELYFRWLEKPQLIHGIQTPEQPPKFDGRGSFFVQPDYEVLALPDTPYVLRWELELCCELKSSDVMTTYRLSRKGVEAALRLGRTPEEVLAFLERYAASGVPDNVQAAVEQWGRELGRTAFARVMLLRCKDVEAAERVAADGELAKLAERVGTLDFIVREAEIARVQRELKRLELAPLDKDAGGASAKPEYPRLVPVLPVPAVSGCATGNGQDNHAEQDNAAVTEWFGRIRQEPGRTQAWIYAGKPVSLYKSDERIPEAEELFPGFREVPGAWTKELRSYHASTTRQLLQQALNWKARIELDIGGTSFAALPLWVKGVGEWRAAVAGAKANGGSGLFKEEDEIEFGPDEVGGVRIILPISN